MLEVLVEILVSIVCVLYISQRWNLAKNRRNAEWSTRPAAGIEIKGKGKPSVFWYLFK
jgi:hypothetical protein